MSELRRSSRRTSANPGYRENATVVNGVGREIDRGKEIQKKNLAGTSEKAQSANGDQRKGSGNPKRKVGEFGLRYQPIGILRSHATGIRADFLVRFR